MGENYLDTIEIDGIDEAMEANLDVDEIESANTTVIDFIIDGSGSMGDMKLKELCMTVLNITKMQSVILSSLMKCWSAKPFSTLQLKMVAM